MRPGGDTLQSINNWLKKQIVNLQGNSGFMARFLEELEVEIGEGEKI